MVVDIRYHLASIVAVFLALGLGILVGAALSGDEGLEQQERWLASLESELQSLRESGERNAELLRQTGVERDRYKEFAAYLSGIAMRGLLDGERAALVVFGSESAAAGRVEDVLRQSGARLVRKAAVAPAWAEADLIRLLAPLDGAAPTGAGAALAGALTGQSGSSLAQVESPSITFQAMSTEQPTIAVILLGDPPDRFREVAAELAEALRREGIRTTAVTPSESAWNPEIKDWEIPLVSRFDTPIGELSLAVSLSAGAASGLGLSGDSALWALEGLR